MITSRQTPSVPTEHPCPNHDNELDGDPTVPQDGPATSETLEDAEVPFAEANPMAAAEESSPSEELSETEAFLVEELGLTQKQMRKIRTFWSYSGDRLPPLTRCQMIADYLQHDVGLNQDQLCRTIADCPEALEVFSVETLKEKVRFLEVEVGVEEPDLPEVVAAYPQVLSRPILTTLRPALEFWMGPANVDPEELPALLKRHAMQMWMRPEALKLKLRFAKEVMGLSLAKVLACSTPFFRLSMEKTVAPRHFFSIQRKVSGPSRGLLAHDLLAGDLRGLPGPCEYSFGLGYGLSMTANAALTAAVTKHQHRRLTPFGLVCCGLYAAYGVPASVHGRGGIITTATLPRRSDMMGISSKLAIVMGVSFSQALYALPLAVAMSPAPTKARPALRAAGWAGVGLAALGLAIEASFRRALGQMSTSSKPREELRILEQLQRDGRHWRLRKLPVMDGLYSASLANTVSRVSQWVFPTFFMAFTLHNSAARSDKEADHRYKNCDGYAQWVESTPILFPGAKRVSPASRGDSVAAVPTMVDMETELGDGKGKGALPLIPKRLSLEDKVGGSDAAFCKKIGAKPAEYKEFLEQWPFSDQARSLAWLQPPRKRRFRSNWSGPSGQNKFKKRNFQKKRSFRKRNNDDEPRSNFDKSQSRSRRPQRPSPDFDESRFEADRSDLFSRAEYREVRIRLLHALMQSDFNGRQYDAVFCEKARDMDAFRTVQAAAGGNVGRNSAQLSMRVRREADQAPMQDPEHGTQGRRLRPSAVASLDVLTAPTEEIPSDSTRRDRVLFAPDVGECDDTQLPSQEGRLESEELVPTSRRVDSLDGKGEYAFRRLQCDRDAGKVEQEWRYDPSLQQFGNQDLTLLDVSGVKLPVDPTQSLGALEPKRCFVANSAVAPVAHSGGAGISGDSMQTGHRLYAMKKGDDLRQDALVLQIFRLMETAWAEHGLREVLPVSLMPYDVLALSPKEGFAAFVPKAKNVSRILEEFDGDITEFIKKHSSGSTSSAYDRLCGSTAGYCVATYLLGIGDRHLDNIMMTEDGHFFHIDFGFVLGEDPKPGCPADTTDFVNFSGRDRTSAGLHAHSPDRSSLDGASFIGGERWRVEHNAAAMLPVIYDKLHQVQRFEDGGRLNAVAQPVQTWSNRVDETDGHRPTATAEKVRAHQANLAQMAVSEEDDLPPPLEATRRRTPAANAEKEKFDGEPEDLQEKNEVAEALMQKALAAREQKKKDTEEARKKVDQGFGGGLKKGFLGGTKAPKKNVEKTEAIQEVSTKRDNKKSTSEEVPFITGAGSAQEAKRMSLQMPEVQQAVQGMSRLKEDQSWITPQLMAAMQSRPDLLKALSDPKIQQAMALMQTAPDEAKRRYANDPEVTKFMQDFSGLMATHFDVLSKEAPNPGKPQAGYTKAPSQPAKASPAQQASPLDDPKVAKAFQDPEVQQLISELYAGKPLEMHELCQQKPHLFQKVKILLDNGLLALQR
ncbi:Phosphatidylinositol 3-kinase vps34 [Symbiodinium microadriaticum]|uniref:Phosphatidylinositol 3-kinase vps34 n=1 Tax=Symbiodinium microadriaticum TaxID=2951 RepID=A0A1Q9DS63_SYMMI|nr:Phosphatidylinositol 3-kinase vps34 [Symbiodinium microadriaticum]